MYGHNFRETGKIPIRTPSDVSRIPIALSFFIAAVSTLKLFVQVQRHSMIRGYIGATYSARLLLSLIHQYSKVVQLLCRCLGLCRVQRTCLVNHCSQMSLLICLFICNFVCCFKACSCFIHSLGSILEQCSNN